MLVEGANVHRAARPRHFNGKPYGCYSRKTYSFKASTSNSLDRPLASIRATAPLKTRGFSPSLTVDQVLAEELGKAKSVIHSTTVPSELDIQNALQTCGNLARGLSSPIDSPKPLSKSYKSPTSNLLSLEEKSDVSSTPSPPEVPLAVPIRSDIVDRISETAYDIILDSKVFITPKLLSTYIYAQSILGRPQSFPQIFDLYASKSIPHPTTFPIKYRDSNPNRTSCAVPLVLAHTALNAAIETKDLALCLGIISTTVCTTAYKRAKFFRRALLPFSGLALAPAAAYVLASQLAQYQQSMDDQLATNLAFVGITAYLGFTATIGFVALTTANDQMDRITWAMGTPLRERWFREEERALVDRVAGAWGFEDPNKRGEEEGTDWEALREWAGSRGMALDRPELMEGME